MTDEQYYLNLCYWVVSLISIALLCLSFYGYMKAIGFGMVIYTIRNVVPLFDLENRKHKLGNANWDFLVILVGCTTLINLQLVNNLFDNSVIFEVFMVATLFVGFNYAVMTQKDEGSDKFIGYSNIAITVALGMIAFRVFLYIQKRVHKEVFFEMKQRTSEQGEFKTIFNELDEGIVIT